MPNYRFGKKRTCLFDYVYDVTWYWMIRPVLFAMEPEQAHEFTMKVMEGIGRGRV